MQLEAVGVTQPQKHGPFQIRLTFGKQHYCVVEVRIGEEVSAQVHDRMPVIVQPKDYQRGLDPENQDVADILAPPPSDGMIAYPVSRRVNSPKNDDVKLIEPEAA
jgi:putative SOS response-associated peptidase YedK